MMTEAKPIRLGTHNLLTCGETDWFCSQPMTGVDKPLSNQIIYKVDMKEDKVNHVGYSLQYHLISIITVASKKEEYTL